MSNVFRKVKAKYCLVQFIEDSVYYVCCSKYFKKSKQGTIIVKWQDGCYYTAKFLASSNNPKLLNDILKNLENNIPTVSLKKLRDIRYIPESPEEKSSNEIEIFDVCNNCFLLYPSESNHLCDNKESTDETQFSSNEGSDIENKDLCIYCGVFAADLKTHIFEAHRKENRSDDEHEKDVKTRYPTKRHYCTYCNTMQTKLARHLERKHGNEIDVKEASKFSKGSQERKSFWLKIQKKADFLYNTGHKKSKEFISLRRNTNKNDTTKVPCPYCQGFYSKTNIRNHVRLNCWKQHSNEIKKFETMGFNNLQVMSRSLAPRIHEKASGILKEKIFPVLNDDEITRAIADDELVIVYANQLVMKYSTSNHHHKMIRNKIRHISRILLAMRKIDSKITNAASIFDPSNFDTFISAVHDLAGLNDGKFSTPSLGPSSVTLICQLGDVLQVESIKKKDTELENNVKQFLKLLVTTASALITKTATENRTQNQRSKVVVLPKTEDVTKLYHCLEFELERCLQILMDKFDHTAWTTLSKVVLIKLLIFNRKRPGDIERSQIIEYNNIQTIDSETLQKLDVDQQKYAAEFSRYITRGKLDSPAAVLVPKKDKEAIELILKYRLEAKVENNNPYLFAAPPGLSDQFYRAGRALQEFCYLTNLENKNLTATKLRKHLATVTCTLNDDVVKRISNFMGHSDKYHHNIYVQRPIIKDVIEMGQVLTNAIEKS